MTADSEVTVVGALISIMLDSEGGSVLVHPATVYDVPVCRRYAELRKH